MPPKGLLSNSPSVALLKETNFQRMAQNNPAQYYQQTPIGAAAIEGLLGTWAGQAYEQDIKPAYDAWTPQWSDLYNAPMAMAEGIGGVMKDAMDDPEDPRKMLDAGLLTVGMGGGATAMLGGVPRGALGMHVWQGGPHKYGAKGASESLQHMSKGEGAQAYGWGRYDAESKGVAEDYKRTLSGDWSDINRVGDALYDALDPLPNGDVLFKGSKYSKAEFDRVIVPQLDGRDLWGSLPPGLRTATEKKLEGHLYKHDLPDEDIARYLDWDAPLSEQPESVRKALGDVIKSDVKVYKNGDIWGVNGGGRGAENFATKAEAEAAAASRDAAFKRIRLEGFKTGENQYNELAKAGGKQAASEALGRAGIPGLKYYDGMSRGTSGGEIIDVFQEGGKWKSKIKVTNRGGTQFADPTDTFTTSMPFDTKEAAEAWAKSKTDTGTRNFVTWDQDVLNRMGLLERNGIDAGLLGESMASGGVKSYHGSDAIYDTMNTTDRALDQSIPNALGDNIGAFFADNTNHAKDFGKNVKAYRVDLKNPKVFKTQDDFRAFIRENSGRTPDTRDAEGFITKEGVFEHKARKTLEEQGYDGVVITRPNYTKSKKSDQPWRIAFDESQVSDWDDKATE